MKNLLVYDWEDEEKKGNPYYSFVDKSKIKLNFFEGLKNLLHVKYEDFDGLITHYPPSNFIAWLSNQPKDKLFPIIQFRTPESEIRATKNLFKAFNINLDNFYVAENSKDLEVLIKKLF